MSNPKRRHQGPPPCESRGPDDGIDPKLLFRPESRRRDDRGVLRLCSQARDALTYALADCGDETLQSLRVDAVQPAPDATRLAVTVRAADETKAATARERLASAAGMLRTEVAGFLRRRRAPELVFRVLLEREDGR
jgi:ribosome-binding factor A